MNKVYELAESNLTCFCGGKRAVKMIQQKHGGVGGIPLTWGEAIPACSQCRKGFRYGSYRLLYHRRYEDSTEEQSLPVKELISATTNIVNERVVVRYLPNPGIQPTFGWFMFLVTVLAMIIIPFIWFIVSGHWLVVN